MSRQGRLLLDSEIRTILGLLGSTDMAIPAIAKRMDCSRSTVVTLNRKFEVRDYAGRRNTWETTGPEKNRLKLRAKTEN